MRDYLNLYFLTFSSFISAALFFTIAGKWKYLQIVQQASWWSNKSIKTDICYVILTPAFKICLRFLPVAVIYLLMLIFMEPAHIYMYLVNGYGPLARLPLFAQGLTFIILADLLSYWSRPLFHMKYVWPLHAIHHGPHDVDWTTAYRFHPLNLAFGSWMIASILIMMGISPVNIIPATALEAIMAYFVHSNLNITLGPCKYFIATPVFHRWHHTHAAGACASNYGAIFSLWDVIFGTYYLPNDQLPTIYGIEDIVIQENYVFQIIYPFNKWYQDIRSFLLSR